MTATEILENVKMIAEGLECKMPEGSFEEPLSFLEKGIEHLKEHDGQLCIVPASFLGDEEHKDLRQKLLQCDVIASVALLRHEWPTKMEDRLSLILLKINRGELNGNIKFIDATDDYLIEAWTGNLLAHIAFPTEELLKFPMDEDYMDELSYNWNSLTCVRGVAYEIKNSSINPREYVDQLPERKGFELWDFKVRDFDIDSSKGIRGYLGFEGHINGKVLHEADLKDSPLHHSLDANDVEGSSYEGRYMKRENTQVVVVQLSNEANLKPTLVNIHDTPLYIPTKNMALVEFYFLDSWDLDYVISELHEDYVKRQLERIIKIEGKLDSSNVETVKIYFPTDENGKVSMERQIEIVQQRRKERIDYLERELQKEREKFLEALCERKRQISQFLFEQNSALSILATIRTQNDGFLSDNMIVDTVTGDTVASIFERMNKLSSQMSHELNDFFEGYDQYFKK